jgi:hypothetical protein
MKVVLYKKLENLFFLSVSIKSSIFKSKNPMGKLYKDLENFLIKLD